MIGVFHHSDGDGDGDGFTFTCRSKETKFLGVNLLYDSMMEFRKEVRHEMSKTKIKQKT